jgi:hypothetical protein
MTTKKSGAAGLTGVVPLNEHPEYVAEVAKLTPWMAEARAIEVAIRQKRDALATPVAKDLESRAAALLPNGEEQGENESRRRRHLRAEIEDLYDRQPLVLRRVKMQQDAVATLAARLSRECQHVLVPTHRAIRRRHLECVVEMARVAEVEAQFWDEVGALGYSQPQLSRIDHIGEFGIASDYNGRAAGIVRQAIEDGIILPTDPLVGTVAALTGDEHFLPANAARVERERKAAAERHEKQQRELTEQREETSNRRLWGGHAAPVAPVVEPDPRRHDRRGPTKQELLRRRVEADIVEELEGVLSLAEVASVA